MFIEDTPFQSQSMLPFGVQSNQMETIMIRRSNKMKEDNLTMVSSKIRILQTDYNTDNKNEIKRLQVVLKKLKELNNDN